MNIVLRTMYIISLAIFITNVCLAQQSFYQDRERGWYYRECIDCKENEKPSKKSNPNNSLSTMDGDQVLDTLKSVQKEMEVRQARYTLEPNVENAHDFLSYQKLMFSNASKASEAMQTALMKYPYLDSRLEDPVSQQALSIKRKEEVRQNDLKILEFAHNFELLYFFKSGCPYCQEFQSVLERVVKNYNFKIVAFSSDLTKHAVFPTKIDRDLSSKLDIQLYPTLIAYNRENNIYLPISRGFLPEDDFKQNILHVYNHIVALSMEVE